MKKYFKFQNGSTISYRKNNMTDASMIRLYFDCGAVCDGKFPGLSHFCEHMFFTGTKDLTSQEVKVLYNDFISVNAETSLFDIAFTGYIEKNRTEEYLGVVARLINDTTFEEDAIKAESKAVIQEIVKSKDGYRNFSVYNYLYLLTKNPVFKNEILGNVEAIESVKTKQFLDYRDKYFVANNVHLMINTPLSFRKVKKIFNKKVLKMLPENKNLPKMDIMIPKFTNFKFYSFNHVDIDKNYVKLCFKLDHDIYDDEFYAKIKFMMEIFNDAAEGILKTVRYEKNLVYSANFNYLKSLQNGYIGISTECSTKNINGVIESFAEYIKNISKNGTSKEMFEKAKKKRKHYLSINEPSVYKQLNELATYRYKDVIHNEKYYNKIIDKFTLDEFNSTIKDLFNTKDFGLAVYGNANENDVMTEKEFRKLF